MIEENSLSAVLFLDMFDGSVSSGCGLEAADDKPELQRCGGFIQTYKSD